MDALKTLQRLVDERDIAVLLATLARILDSREWARVSEVVAADVSFDYTDSGTDVHGREALLANFRQFLDVCGPSQHLLGSIIVEVNGDSALSRSYVQARHRSKDPADPRLFDSNGEYIDRWERGAEGWRMVHRRAIWASMSGDPSVIGFGG
jgi:ketosteroid isomerase-like protein